MGRGKIDIKRIENTSNRQVTFSKRRNGLIKKANELAILCDAQVGLIIFSCTGKMFEFCSSPLNLSYLMNKYQKHVSVQGEEFGARHQMMHEITRMKEENDKLELFIQKYLGKDLAGLTIPDMDNLIKDLESSLYKVRTRKEELLNQQVLNLRRKEHIMEDENNYLYRQLELVDDPMVPIDQKPGPSAMMDLFGDVYHHGGAPTELPAYRLQPMQPNLQHVGFPSHGLQL